MSQSRILSTLPTNLANNVGNVATVISGTQIGWVAPQIVTISDSVSSNSSANAASSNAVSIAVATALAYSIALG